MKMLDEELLNTAKQEIELLSSINHPNIIKGFDFLTYCKGAVMSLEYFPGPTLDIAVGNASGGVLVEDTARFLFKCLMSAVEHLHKLGIIHRDVKAQNILVSDNLDNLKLVDFNTAQRVMEGGALTLTGTVDYLPP